MPEITTEHLVRVSCLFTAIAPTHGQVDDVLQLLSSHWLVCQGTLLMAITPTAAVYQTCDTPGTDSMMAHSNRRATLPRCHPLLLSILGHCCICDIVNPGLDHVLDSAHEFTSKFLPVTQCRTVVLGSRASSEGGVKLVDHTQSPVAHDIGSRHAGLSSCACSEGSAQITQSHPTSIHFTHGTGAEHASLSSRASSEGSGAGAVCARGPAGGARRGRPEPPGAGCSRAIPGRRPHRAQVVLQLVWLQP